jgi:hypothetical protein
MAASTNFYQRSLPWQSCDRTWRSPSQTWSAPALSTKRCSASSRRRSSRDTRSSRSSPPALNFTLNEGARDAGLGAFNHAGIQVESTDDVLAAKLRLKQAGLASFDEMDTTCCYAHQDKIWVHDPDGTPWEVFATHGDVEDPEPTGAASACCAG